MALMDSLGGISNSAMSILILFVSLLFAAGIAFAAFKFWQLKKRYDEFKCIIWEKDMFGQIIESYDKAGIFVDNKTNNKRLFLKKYNVGLNADQVPFINSGKYKIIYLYRFGLKNFVFLKPTINDDKFQITVGEEDVNWAVNSYERIKKIFDMNKLAQYLPFIMLAFVSIIILIIFIYLFRKLDVLKEVSANLLAMSREIATMNGGGTAQLVPNP